MIFTSNIGCGSISIPVLLLLLTIGGCSAMFLLLLFNMYRRHSTRRFPPGPLPFPLIGNFAQIDLANPHRSFVAWKRRYGPIYTVWLPKPIVVIANETEMDKYFMGSTYGGIFADRPTHSFLYGIFSKHQPDGDGIILARREVSHKNRRFALSAFRRLGIGGARGEARVNVHKDALLKRLAERALHEPFLDDVPSQFAFCFGNIIHDLVTGRYYEYNDTEFLHFKELIDQVIEAFSGVQMLLVDTHPALRFVMPAYWRYRRAGFALQSFFLREIDSHIARAQNSDAHADDADNFIDAFLHASRVEGQNWHDPTFKLTLALCAGDLWAAGLETVVSTMTWAVIYLLNHPESQTKLHTELADLLQGRAFRLADRAQLPYLRAFIDELQRCVNILPWNLPHSVSQEVKLSNADGTTHWTIPANTLVMPQLGAVHLDPECYPEPERFWPERFLSEKEGGKDGAKWLKPFGIGKRSCLGEQLARMELAIVIAGLSQNFHFETLDGKSLSVRRNAGLTSTPDPFKCIISLRPDEPILS